MSLLGWCKSVQQHNKERRLVGIGNHGDCIVRYIPIAGTSDDHKRGWLPCTLCVHSFSESKQVRSRFKS